MPVKMSSFYFFNQTRKQFLAFENEKPISKLLSQAVIYCNWALEDEIFLVGKAMTVEESMGFLRAQGIEDFVLSQKSLMP